MMKAEFISRVMQIMNELGWNDTESNAFIGSDTTMVEKHIEQAFTDAWCKAVRILPKHYFTVDDFSKNEHVGDCNTGVGYVMLPDNYYTLFSFKMKGWKKCVDTADESTGLAASIQANEYTRGNIIRPVCLLSQRQFAFQEEFQLAYKHKRVLEYYSLPLGKNHVIEEALYIPFVGLLSEETKLSEKLFIPLAYICASIVFDIFEKNDLAKVLLNTATTLWIN